MQSKNRNFLIGLALLFMIGEIILGYVAHEKSIEYAKVQNERHLNEILLRQRALHKYVEETLKPVFYELKAEGKLYKEFFDPRGLSFTYIARHIHKNLLELHDENSDKALFKDGSLYYKLATDNPRNELNRATPKEAEILQRFRDGELKKYSETIHEDGYSYIYHAIPIAPNKESCMRCHSTPDVAPAEMVEQYGSEKGFGEKVGNIRAMISLKVPFDHELNEAMWLYNLMMLFLSLFLLLLYGVIFFFVKKLDRSEQIIQGYTHYLEKEVEYDGLTKALNRRSFDTLMKKLGDDDALTLAIVDIDFFKRINDNYGHQIGDDILITLTAFLKQNLRDDDRLFRIGGEEFAIVFFDQEREAIDALFTRLFEKLSQTQFAVAEEVSVSAGIAVRQRHEAVASLYKRADDALYSAKEEGRKRFIFSS